MHRLDALAVALAPFAAVCLAAASATAQSEPMLATTPPPLQNLQSFNPAISAIADMFYHTDDADEGVAHVWEEVAGFGHAEAEDEHGHEHAHGPEDGFNLRHVELQFSAAVDPYFKAATIAAIDEDGAELETAEIETTSLPGGLKLRGGKFFSDFSYVNAQHAHQWDFSDQPLIHALTLGDHGLNDKGAQLSWLAPAPFYLLAGAEAFQGDNEQAFQYLDEEPLPTHDGPRLGIGWLKLGPNLPDRHALQLGLSAGQGKHQEAHAEDAGTEFFDGDTAFWSAEAVYKFNAPHPHGQGDITFQTEYFSREKDLDLVAAEVEPDLVGRSKTDEQDGYYAQAVYGFLPRWRLGLRWELVGVTNQTREPDGTSESFDSSDRVAAMLDFTPSEFSRLRLQANSGDYATTDGTADVVELYVQWMVSLGAHGAHKF